MKYIFKSFLFIFVFQISKEINITPAHKYLIDKMAFIVGKFIQNVDEKNKTKFFKSECGQHMFKEIFTNDYLLVDIIFNFGYDSSKLSDEKNCLINKWAYYLLTYESDNSINYTKGLYSFLEHKVFHVGLCLWKECFEEFIDLFKNNETIGKIFPKTKGVKIFGINFPFDDDIRKKINESNIHNYIFNQEKNSTTNKKEECQNKISLQNYIFCLYQEDFLTNIQFFLIIYIMARIIFTFYFKTLNNNNEENFNTSLQEIDINIPLNKDDISEKDEVRNYLIDHTDITETNIYKFSKGLSFLSSLEYLFHSNKKKPINQLLGIRVIIVFLIISCENCFALFKIPNIGMSIYNVIDSYFFFIIKILTYSYDFYKVICGAILGYIFLDYFKKNEQSKFSIKTIFKFYLVCLPYVSSFFILYFISEKLIKIIGEYYYPTVHFQFFTQYILNYNCSSDYTLFFPFKQDENNNCYKSTYFLVSEFYCFIFLTSISFLLIKKRARILDYSMFCLLNALSLILYILGYWGFKEEENFSYSISKIFGNINTIKKPHLFFILYYLGFNFGIIYYYRKNITHFSPNFFSKDEILIPFKYNYDTFKYLSKSSKLFKKISRILILVLIILLPFNYTLLRKYDDNDNNNNFILILKENEIIKFIYYFEGLFAGLLFVLFLLIFLIASNIEPLEKLFSNDISLSVNKLAFIIFNCTTSIIVIVYSSESYNSYFNIKNILLTSFPISIFIISFSLFYGTLIELPITFYSNQFLSKNRKEKH
jgi:hypothetical protein